MLCRSHALALLAALAVTLLWSASWVLIRLGLDDEGLEPLGFAGLRYGLAAVVLWLVVAVRPRTRAVVRTAARRDLWGLVVLGVVLYGVTQGAQFVAIDAQPAATTSLVLSMTPLLVAFAAGAWLGEAATRAQLAGAGLVAVGAALYALGSLGATALGMTAAVVGLVANAAAVALGRAVNRRVDSDPLAVTAVSMSAGAVLLVASGLLVEGPPTVSPGGAALVCWLAVVHTALAFTLWSATQRRLHAVESAVVNNTMLVQIAVLGWVFLAEPLDAVQVVGVAAVSAGALVTQLRARAGGLSR